MNGGNFKIKYPIRALDGGLNNKYEPGIIDDIESPDCLNVVTDDRGAIRTRYGYVKLNSNAVGSFLGEGLFTNRFNDGTEKMVGWWNGSYFRWDGTTFVTVPSAESIYTAGGRVQSEMYQNLAFFGNGGSVPYKDNGTEFTRMGIPVPSAPASAVSNGTGVVSGSVLYKITNVNSFLVEGDLSSFTTTISVTSATVGLTGVPVAPASHGVASRRIYRASSATDPFKRVGEIADNTTTTFDDNVSDADLGVTAPTDQGQPPNFKFIVKHQERLFLIDPADPQFLWYTELANPFVVKADNFIKISDGDGEEITGVSVHANGIAIRKDNTVWFIFMPSTDPTEWQRIRTNSEVGGGGYVSEDIDGRLFFMGKSYAKPQGFFQLQGVQLSEGRTDIQDTSIRSKNIADRIEPDIFNFNQANLHKSTSIKFDNKVWVAVPYADSTINNRVYQYDFQRRDKDRKQGSFVPFDGIYAADFTIFGGKLYFQSSQAVGRVYQLESGGYNDDGEAINSYVWLKEFSGHAKDSEYEKDFRHAEFIMETLGDWRVNFTHKVDSDRGSGNTQQLDLNPGGSLWGSMRWGTDSWGGGVKRKTFKLGLKGSRGQRIQFKVDNGNVADQAFKVIPNSRFYYNKRGIR